MPQDPRTYVSPREHNEYARFQLRRSHLRTSIPGVGMVDERTPGFYLSSAPDVPSVMALAAARLVCAHATSVDDARELLALIGLHREVIAPS